jgi:hypothetical protein
LLPAGNSAELLLASVDSVRRTGSLLVIPPDAVAILRER